MAMRHGGGARNASAAFSAQNASGSECRQSRSSVFSEVAEERLRRSRRGYILSPARGRMMPFARVEHGLPLRQRMLPSFPGAYPARPPLTAFSKRKCSHDRLPDGGGASLHTPLTRRASGGQGYLSAPCHNRATLMDRIRENTTPADGARFPYPVTRSGTFSGRSGPAP